MAHYNHDVSHCHQTQCELYEKCYRGFLDRELKNSGWTMAWYFKPEKTGKDCEYFLNKDNY